MALPLYALTLFVSAFILFLVQPIVGKIILPKLGGTPQVWNTCMVFFQMVLLAGYAYTHNASTRLTLRQQIMAHLLLLALPVIVLAPFPFAFGGEFQEAQTGAIKETSKTKPIQITAPNHNLETGNRVSISGVHSAANTTWSSWPITVTGTDTFTLDESDGKGASDYSSGGSYVGGPVNPSSLWGFVPELGSNPIPSTLKILFLYIMLPFLVVSTTAPLLQKWFVYTGHPASKDPYFLYGASNFGSMLSLIVYPILIEPYVSLYNQGWAYTIGYATLAVFVLACAATVWGASEPTKPKPEDIKPEPAPSTPAAPPPAPQTGITATPPAHPSTALKPGQPPKAGAPKSIALDPTGRAAADVMTMGRRVRWILLAAIPSSLMLGITTHITTDLSPIPLFWLVPLILYLASFIFVFARWPVVWTEAPHTFFLYAQPFCVWFMIMADVWGLTSSPALISIAVFAHTLGFFATTMVCHGELAKDRPGTRYLTEFYLCMSVGGMLGGMFNGLIAPVVFKRLEEFPLAIFAAGLVRPRMFEFGFLDSWMASMFEGQSVAQPATKPGHKGAKHVPVVATSVTPSESLVRTLDFAWPIVVLLLTAIFAYLLSGPIVSLSNMLFRNREPVRFTMTMIMFGIPLLIACACLARPLRIGLGIGAVILMHHLYLGAPAELYDRSYFGAISVRKDRAEITAGNGKKVLVSYHQLTHGTTNHGMNFEAPESRKDYGDPNKDFRNLATTYYHREGPVGRVMEKYNWFKGQQNTFSANARMPASLAASLLGDISIGGGVPASTFTTLWSEPPLATVGLGTGTMASYARPYQHCHFYEIDNHILRLSLYKPTRLITSTKDKKTIYQEYEEERVNARRPTTYFNYLERAIERGAIVQVLMGDARQRMALPYENHYVEVNATGKDFTPRTSEKSDKGGGPMNFYHMMVVDAFSSDAIPAHLLTEQAFKMYFDRLTEKGILCVHTSNKFVELPKVVAAVSSKLGYAHLRGHDVNKNHEEGHYNSEWVMVARKQEYLDHLDKDLDFLKDYYKKTEGQRRANEKYWEPVLVDDRFVWTDDYYNMMSVIVFFKSRHE